MSSPHRPTPDHEPPTAAAPAVPDSGWVGRYTDPNWRPPLAGTLQLGAQPAVGPWGYQRPAPLLSSRSLRDQFIRTYPNRAFPVRLESTEAYQLSCACTDYQRQMGEMDAA